MELDPHENLRGMSREPLQNIDELSAVSRRISSTEEDLGPGKTETEAPELTRNSRPERTSCTNKRVTRPEKKLQTNRQDGLRNPPAGLLVSRKGTGFSTIGGLHTMFIVIPAESRRS